MSLESVTIYFSKFELDHRIIVLETSTATVDEAASAHNVQPDQIGKTLSFTVNEKPLLIVVSGASKIDNRKYKAHFLKKAKMMNPQAVLEQIGHEIGGVCPFGLTQPIDVYLDITLKKHQEIIPAAGCPNSAIRLSIEELERYSNFKEWIDVCQ